MVLYLFLCQSAVSTFSTFPHKYSHVPLRRTVLQQCEATAHGRPITEHVCKSHDDNITRRATFHKSVLITVRVKLAVCFSTLTGTSFEWLQKGPSPEQTAFQQTTPNWQSNVQRGESKPGLNSSLSFVTHLSMSLFVFTNVCTTMNTFQQRWHERVQVLRCKWLSSPRSASSSVTDGVFTPPECDLRTATCCHNYSNKLNEQREKKCTSCSNFSQAL